jgi:uncharacterized protein YjbI with pentapeptide repeats
MRGARHDLVKRRSSMKRIAVIVLALIASVGLGFATASALNPADLQHLETTGSCVDCDLSGALLIHWKLRGADLAGANLMGANLTDTYLAGANLMGANLANAILISTSLAGANLFRAELGASALLFVDFADAIWVDGSRCERPSSGWCKR